MNNTPPPAQTRRPCTYESLPTTLTAMQFDGTFSGHDAIRAWMAHHPSGDITAGLTTAYRGLDMRLTESYRYRFWCHKAQTEVSVAAGDWVAEEADGSGFYPVESVIFPRRWRPANRKPN